MSMQTTEDPARGWCCPSGVLRESVAKEFMTAEIGAMGMLSFKPVMVASFGHGFYCGSFEARRYFTPPQ